MRSTEIRPPGRRSGSDAREYTAPRMFTRGQTQICNVCDTGSALRGAEDWTDWMRMSTSKRYMHHYNFPSYLRWRDQGPAEDRDAVRSVMARWRRRRWCRCFPPRKSSPMRSAPCPRPLESNGSTSQASICASTAVPDGGRRADQGVWWPVSPAVW